MAISIIHFSILTEIKYFIPLMDQTPVGHSFPELI